MINLNPFINLTAAILSLYTWLLIIYVILYYLIMFKVVNPYNKFINQVNRFLIQAIEPVLTKIRHYLPPIAGVDIAMIALFLGIQFFKDILYTYFYVY